VTTRDRIRRTVIGVAVVALLVGFVLALNSGVDFDQNGDPSVPEQDISGVVESGDADAIADAPAPLGPDAPTQAELVEQLIPAADSQQLRQVQIGIDLAPGYDAHLKINHVAVDDTELQRRPELNQVFFRPGEGLSVEALQPGDNLVEADIYDVVTGQAIRSVEWHFTVT
jgi:hypothetical protein